MSSRDSEIEQVPLKSDMQPAAVNNGCETDPESKKEEETKFKKEGKVSKKICKIWHRHGPKNSPTKVDEEEEPKSPSKKKMSIGLDMVNRDDKAINEHIVMEFGEVFAEPDSSHSFNWTWLSANRVYTATSSAVYKTLAAIIAIPFAIIFGVLFAITALVSVFFCTPLGVLISIPINAVAKAWSFFVRKLLTPISISLFCRRQSRTTDAAPELPA